MPKKKQRVPPTDSDRMLKSIGDFRMYLEKAYLCQVVRLRDSVMFVLAYDEDNREYAEWCCVDKYGSLFTGNTAGRVTFDNKHFLAATIESIHGVWVGSGKFTEQAHEFKEAVESLLTEASLTRVQR